MVGKISEADPGAIHTPPELNFGRVPLNPEQEKCFAFLNAQVLDLCATLPAPLQSRALLFVQGTYAGFQLTGLHQFFAKFYPPTWTQIFWLQRRWELLSAEQLAAAYRGQAMAMFLHMLDNHLVDGQVPMSHPALQLRTAAWTEFQRHTRDLSGEAKAQEALCEEHLSNYFSGMVQEDCPSLEDYLENFRRQMQTGLLIPRLMAARHPEGLPDFAKAFENFGMAWRLLDDLRDRQEDMAATRHSGVYFLAPRFVKKLWDGVNGDTAPENLEAELQRMGVLDHCLHLILKYLQDAAKAAQGCGLRDYAEEFEKLKEPIAKFHEAGGFKAHRDRSD